MATHSSGEDLDSILHPLLGQAELTQACSHLEGNAINHVSKGTNSGIGSKCKCTFMLSAWD